MAQTAISVCTDTENRISSLCPDDLSGCTDWQRTTVETLGIGMGANLYDDHGACMYKLVNGAAVQRSEEERRADWPEEPEEPPEPISVEQLRADVDYIAMETGVDLE